MHEGAGGFRMTPEQAVTIVIGSEGGFDAEPLDLRGQHRGSARLPGWKA
jgi:16S rRNA U1498 N3-methylase RsmE